MPAHSGRARQIEAYVAKHPGCERRELLTALGLGMHDAMPSYACSIGLIFAAGPRCSQRYYPTLEQAHEADALIRAETKLRRQTLKAEAHKRANQRRRARRHAAGGKVVNSRPGACVHIEAGVILSTDVRMTPARPMLSRWESLVVPSVVSSADARPWAHACAAGIAGGAR